MNGSFVLPQHWLRRMKPYIEVTMKKNTKETFTYCNDCYDKLWAFEDMGESCPNGHKWCVREPVMTEEDV